MQTKGDIARMRIPRIPKLDGVMLDLNNSQLYKLAGGNAVKIMPKMLTGNGFAVGLTDAQKKRLVARCQSGNGLVPRGTSLKLTKKQLQHHMQHGTGIFSDLVRKIWGYTKQAYTVAKPFVKPILKQAYDEIADVARDEGIKFLKRGVASGTKRTVDKIKKTSDELSAQLGFANDDVQARGQLPVALNGNGFIKDGLFNLVKGGAKIVKDDVVPVLINEGKKVIVDGIKQKLKGGNMVVKKRRCRTQKGGAIFM